MKLTQEEVQWLKLAGFGIQLPKDERLEGTKTVELLPEVITDRAKTAGALKGLATALEGSTDRAVRKIYKKRYPVASTRQAREQTKNEIAAEAKPLAEKLRAFAEELVPEAEPK